MVKKALHWQKMENFDVQQSKSKANFAKAKSKSENYSPIFDMLGCFTKHPYSPQFGTHKLRRALCAAQNNGAGV